MRTLPEMNSRLAIQRPQRGSTTLSDANESGRSRQTIVPKEADMIALKQSTVTSTTEFETTTLQLLSQDRCAWFSSSSR
jgi:hypothetical protein